MTGFAWDLWPRDTGRPRIAVGHCMEEPAARVTVEELLARHPDALMGTVTRPDLTADVCRRSRRPGQFVWAPVRQWPSRLPSAS